MITDENEKIICALSKKGKSLRDIASIARVSHETIRAVLNKNNAGRKLIRKNINHDKVRKEYEKTECYQRVAEKFKISRSYVFYIVNKNKKKGR